MERHPGRWVLNLAQAQKRYTAIKPHLVVQIPGATADFFTEVEGIPVDFIKAPIRFRAATFFLFDTLRVSGRVRALRPDFVHAHGTEECYSLAAQHSGFPNVITLQGCYFLINREVPPGLISRGRLVGITEAFALKRAHDVIAKSDYVAGEVLTRFPHLALHQVPNTFDSRLLDIALAAAKEKHTLVFVGTVDVRKGFDVLRRAIEILDPVLPGLSLQVFGNAQAPTPFEAGEIAALRSVLGERLILHGVRPALEVAEKVACCEALVAPSREEMFGNQVIEALLVQTQVVVADHTAMAENVRRFGRGRVVPQGDPAGLARVLAEVLEAPADSGEAGRARARVIEHMGPEKVALQHERIYRDIQSRIFLNTKSSPEK